jgi:ABC-type transport system involved in cytochrome c biogenesis permease subunit
MHLISVRLSPWYHFPVFLLGILAGSLLWGFALAIFYGTFWTVTRMPWAAALALAVTLVSFGLAVVLDARSTRARVIRRRLSWGRL